MAIQLTSNWKAYGYSGTATNTVNATVSPQSWDAPAQRTGGGERLIPATPYRDTTCHLWATPRITGHLNRDNALVVTKVKAVNIYFEYNNYGNPVGNRVWSVDYMAYYVRQAAGGWHWTNVYTWTDTYYYGVVKNNIHYSISNKLVWEGEYAISPGESWSLDFLNAEAKNGSVGISTITIKNTYTKPANTKPTFSPECKANPANGNTIIFDGGGDWGYCDKQSNTSSYEIFDNASMTTSIRSGNGYVATVSGLSPNTQYWAKFTKSNGCLSEIATCSATTVTPNSLSNATPIKFDEATVRLSVTNGGGVYEPNTQIQIKKCDEENWTNVATSATTSVESITLTGLDDESCYQVRALTTTDAGTYVGNVVSFTTPQKGLCLAEFTKIDPGMNEKTYEATVDICYKWETAKIPATIVVRYQVKDGYDKTWYETEPLTVNDLTGEHCFTLGELYPNQTVYQTYIHTETEDGEWDSPMSEFVTAVIPEPDIHNCDNFTYLTELLCQSVKKLFNGNKTIYANPYSQALCDPYNEDPTLLTLWSRALRLFHAMYCLICDMGNARLSASKPGQYLVGEAGWQDIITMINDNANSENWKIATSNAIWQYMRDKLHGVWHYHGQIDVLVYELENLSQFPNATSAIVTSENAIYRKVDGAWQKSTSPEDEIDNMGVWHINMESNTQAGYVQAGSAWYYWEDNWQPLDANIAAYTKVIEKMEDKADRLIYIEQGTDRLHIETKDRIQFNCGDYPQDERWVTFITEPLSVPPPGYYEVQFVTGSNATIIQPQQVLSGALAQKPTDPTRIGYVFNGWLNNANNTSYNWSMPVTTNLVLKANWTPQPIIVSFDINGGTGVPPATLNLVYGATIPDIPDSTGFSKTGYHFVGWSRDGVPVDETTQMTGDTVLKAVWEPNVYTVTFDEQNDNNIIEQTGEYMTQMNSPADPTLANSLFMGWFTAPTGGSLVTFPINVTQNVTYYAHYVPATYTVTFDSNGGSPVSSQTVPYQGSVEMPEDPTLANHVFDVWMLDGMPYQFGEMVTSDLTLVATWSSVYTVTFVLNGGDGVIPAQTVVDGDYALEPDAPTKEGQVFVGWFDDETEFDFDNTPIISDLILMAKWEDAPTELTT